MSVCVVDWKVGHLRNGFLPQALHVAFEIELERLLPEVDLHHLARSLQPHCGKERASGYSTWLIRVKIRGDFGMAFSGIPYPESGDSVSRVDGDFDGIRRFVFCLKVLIF